MYEPSSSIQLFITLVQIMQMTPSLDTIRVTISGTFPVRFMKIYRKFSEICASQKLPDFWIFGQPDETRFSLDAYESCKVSPSLRIYNFYSILQGKHSYFLTNMEKIASFSSFYLYPVSRPVTSRMPKCPEIFCLVRSPRPQGFQKCITL